MVLLQYGTGHPGLMWGGFVPFVTKLHFYNRRLFFFFLLIQPQFQEP